jgi:hypothetical protein
MGVNLTCLGIRKASRHPLYVARLISRMRPLPASSSQSLYLGLNMANRIWNTVGARSNVGEPATTNALMSGLRDREAATHVCFDPPRFGTGNWGLGSSAYRHSSPLLLYYSIQHTRSRTEDASQTITRDTQTRTPLSIPIRKGLRDLVTLAAGT